MRKFVFWVIVVAHVLLVAGTALAESDGIAIV